MPAVTSLMVAGLALSAGSMIYGMATAPGSPNLGPPPAPPNNVQYGDDGEIISTQTYDEKTNTWITKGRNSEPTRPDYKAPKPNENSFYYNDPNTEGGMPVFKQDEYNSAVKTWENASSTLEDIARNGVELKTPITGVGDGATATAAQVLENKRRQDLWDSLSADEQKEWKDYITNHEKWTVDKAQRDADKQKLTDLRRKMLDNLSTTPEEDKARYEAYAKSFSDTAHANVDPQFQKIARSADEQANATGMFGSRAYVDTKSELAQDKLKTDTEIANQAIMAKETLASNDRTYWMNMLNQIDTGARADTLAASQVAKNTADITNQNYASSLGSYTAQANATLAKWNAERAQSASYINAGTGLASGLLYLYGGSKGGGTGGTSLAPTGGGVAYGGQKFSLLGGN